MSVGQPLKQLSASSNWRSPHLDRKAKILWNLCLRALMWLFWRERNRRLLIPTDIHQQFGDPYRSFWETLPCFGYFLLTPVHVILDPFSSLMRWATVVLFSWMKSFFFWTKKKQLCLCNFVVIIDLTHNVFTWFSSFLLFIFRCNFKAY